MNKHSLPVFLSTTLLGALLAVTSVHAQGVPAATGAAEQAPIAKDNAGTKDTPGSMLVTRSDGSTGHTRVPDANEIRKLVGYIRDGMNRADQADKQRVTKRVIQNRRH
jgi:hypothetical protein